jgi:hypothetical protein
MCRMLHLTHKWLQSATPYHLFLSSLSLYVYVWTLVRELKTIHDNFDIYIMQKLILKDPMAIT